MEMDEAVDEPLQLLEDVDDAFGMYLPSGGRFLPSLMKIGQVVAL